MANFTSFKRVIIESPYKGTVAFNTEYARIAIRDSLRRGEAPLASHLLYTQPGILRDDVPDERMWGINAGLAWAEVTEKVIIYADLGVSDGMRLAIRNADFLKKPIEYRRLFTDGKDI